MSRDEGFASGARQLAQAGFTLIEVLVALAVFSLAALALLKLQGGAIATTADLDGRVLAGIVAENQVAEAMLGAGPARGQEVAGGRAWRWERIETATIDPGVIRVEVRVTGPDGREAGRAAVLRAR